MKRTYVLFPVLAIALPLYAVACGGETQTAPPPPPPPGPTETASAPPPPPASSPTVSASAAPPAAPEIPFKPVVDFAALPPLRAAKPDDKKIVAAAGDIKKTHAECAGAPVRVASQATGAFTTKGATETAYVLEWTCGKGKAQTFVHKLLILDAAGKAIREHDVNASQIGGITDLDLDGDNEIVVVSVAGALTARLVDVSDGDIKIVYEWAQLGSHDCVNGTQDAPKLVYRKTDKSMDFHAEPSKRACSAAPAASSAASAKAPPKK